MRLVAYIVTPDPEEIETKVALVNMKGRVLHDWEDARRWLLKEAPNRPDLAGRRIDIVDADEKLDKRR